MRRTQHQQQQHPNHPPASASAAAAPIIDNTQLPKPILLRCDDEGSIGVRISGFPQPTVRWQIGRKRIKESSKYQLKTDTVELIHSLVIARVTADLDQGVWVIATNQHGEDCCLIEVKTYSMLSGKRNTDSMTKQNDLHSGDDGKKVLKKKRRGSSHDTQSIVSLDTYKAEMDHRRRMRSADTSINSIDAQSSYSEMIEGVGAAGSRPRGGSKRASRRDQVPTDLQHKRYSSTEAVHNELRSNSIPPLSLDAQSFASASSIPGTPYEERHMPDLNGNADEGAAQDPAKMKKSRRTRSASLTSKSQDDSDNPPRRKKVPRVPKTTVSTTTAANTNPDDLEKLKPPLPPTAAAKKLTPEIDQLEFAEIKPRKKKAKKRTTSKSSIASADDTLDKSLEELDKPTNQSPNATTIDQETIEDPKVNNETAEDVSSTSQIDQPLKVAKKPRKRTTSKSSTTSANILDKSLEDWNKSPDVTVGHATETKQLIVETVKPVEPKKLSDTEDFLTHVTDDKKTDISTDDKNNNDIWDLFGMKLNVLCQHLLNGKHGIAPIALQIKMKNQTNKQTEINPEFIDNEAVVLVEQEVDKSPAVTNGVCNDLKRNGLILTSDDSNDKLPDLSVEIKPPTGKKKKKQPKTLQKDSPEKVEDRSSEHHLPTNSIHESAVDVIDIKPEIPIRKTGETSFKVHLKNHSPETFVNQNNTNSRERSWPVINHDMQLNTGEKEANAPNQKFEYNVDGSDPESPSSTKDAQSDLLNFDSDRLKVASWESREFDDIMRRKATPPLITSSYRISLKPARSEESLAMRPRSEADVGYGRRRCELLPAAGRLRVARSVDRLNADDREASVPLIKRRSLSKEWKIVTVTTTEEIVFVQKGKNDTKQVNVEPAGDFIQKEENDIKQTDGETATDLVENGENDTKRVDVEPERDHDVEDSDIKSSCPNPNEIKYIDSEDSMDMDDDFTWPSPPPIPDKEMPPLTREYAVKQINADVRLVVPISSGTTPSTADQEKPLMKPSPPRIESTIRSRIEMLSFFGYDRIPKPSDTKTSETQTISTVEPPTPEVPPPLNLNSFPERTQVHSLDMSTEIVALQPNKKVDDFPMTSSTVDTKPTSVVGDDDEVFGDKGENGGRQQTVENKTSSDTRPVSQDMSTQTDQTDGGIEPAKSSDSTSPKVVPKPVIQTKAVVLENTEKATFELVANSCRVLTTKREEKREGPEPQDTYYVVEHNECVSPVIIHEYGEMLSFCKKQRSLSDAELNIQKTQQQKLEIQLRLQSLWSLGPQRTTEFTVQKSHESLLSDALSAHLANINAAASSRLAETRATYLLETFRTSPTRDQLTSGDVGSTKLGFYSRRPFSDSNL